MKQLPLFPTSSRFAYSDTIGGSEYWLEFRWVERAASWYFSISMPDRTPLVSGARIVTTWNLTKRAKDERLPDGMFYVVDVSGTGRDIEKQSDLGSRVFVVFIPADEIAPKDVRPAFQVVEIGRTE